MSGKSILNCLKFSSVAILLLFLQPAFAQSKKKDREIGLEKFPELDALVTKNQKMFGNNMVAMVWTDTLVFKKETGDFDAKTQAPIASASKWLTAALVMQFVDEGKISLDDKITQYI
ncbi:MAG TPA: serine hydrolase domain-containing protein, partial [Flavisolibacter sp.]